MLPSSWLACEPYWKWNSVFKGEDKVVKEPRVCDQDFSLLFLLVIFGNMIDVRPRSWRENKSNQVRAPCRAPFVTYKWNFSIESLRLTNLLSITIFIEDYPRLCKVYIVRVRVLWSPYIFWGIQKPLARNLAPKVAWTYLSGYPCAMSTSNEVWGCYYKFVSSCTHCLMPHCWRWLSVDPHGLMDTILLSGIGRH